MERSTSVLQENGGLASLRFAREDWLAAGAILGALPGSRSAEARAAIAAFAASRDTLEELLTESTSGRELIALGFGGDVELAARVDMSGHVPRLEEGAFVALRGHAL